MRTDCQMEETRGAVSLVFPVCTQPSGFRYVPAETATGVAEGTSMQQVIVYEVQLP
jgi:hypothetical protein